jgi:acetyltransferase-like isoleucine patch superfamily enzyme
MTSIALAADGLETTVPDGNDPILYRRLYPWQLAVWIAHTVLQILPNSIGFRVRSRVYRLLGIDSAASAYIMGNIAFRGGERRQHRLLKIGFRTRISSDLTVNLDDRIVIGDFVTIGPYVKLYTSTHEIGASDARCDHKVVAKPIVIGDGAWLALGVTVLPGVRIGNGVVVSAGSLVNRDLPPDTLCGGVPARVIRRLPPSGI